MKFHKFSSIFSLKKSNSNGMASMQSVTDIPGGQAAGGREYDDIDNETVASPYPSTVHRPIFAHGNGGGGADCNFEKRKRANMRQSITDERRERFAAATDKRIKESSQRSVQFYFGTIDYASPRFCSFFHSYRRECSGKEQGNFGERWEQRKL